MRRAAARVQFKTGDHRDYILFAWTRHGKKPIAWTAASAVWTTGTGPLDLADPAGVAAAETVLAKLAVPTRPA